VGSGVVVAAAAEAVVVPALGEKVGVAAGSGMRLSRQVTDSGRTFRRIGRFPHASAGLRGKAHGSSLPWQIPWQTIQVIPEPGQLPAVLTSECAAVACAYFECVLRVCACTFTDVWIVEL
jgi:hypothetical protein